MRMSLQKQLSRGAAFMAFASAMSFAGAQEAPGTCASYALSQEVEPGATDGAGVSVAVGDTFTFTMTPGTATSASWRIVSDGSGSPGSTLTPGGTVSGTLTYTVTAANPSAPVGYYVDSVNGTATITASCRKTVPATAVPSLSEWGLLLTSGLLAMASGMVLRRRRAPGRKASQAAQ
ncbi:hypothetical protein GCM10027082_40880 [Comamonas humi]